ncbi:MAG: P-II family nitrogen regulator [Methanocorpusculum sp.]|uniref:P-II family nitrogen regulator n=1 Tax=Methanocorpusculum petauri TaxID=3002863 RepID=A0ABT4IHD0_9EURY|nr:P-II family nitrogen regulator [Methanocorpusculum petauri]MCZ9312079.1 P-II family nitrogen regulator [Methanocorpusculum sp.]MCZ0861158.1 P-II family nitrogen regulator [Methanocorpusculum petauri]MDE2442841.1 P-II family nitrogen regulator [Methanocorpusculum sp.]MDE2518712.1 P-II family nitrogen regulator [Methanocorpusculum sp.]MDE2522577.1 P-II family nitrogen regulator [Methanocorpusculum sp.]
MKMIVAVIRPEKVDDVVDALEEVNIPGVTITDVRGRGEQGGICLQYRAGKMQIHTLPKTKLEIVIPDKDVDSIIKIIRDHARTGKKGDGRIFVLPVDAAAWVRTDDFITG